jgi:hypothetical protein
MSEKLLKTVWQICCGCGRIRPWFAWSSCDECYKQGRDIPVKGFDEKSFNLEE